MRDGLKSSDNFDSGFKACTTLILSFEETAGAACAGALRTASLTWSANVSTFSQSVSNLVSYDAILVLSSPSMFRMLLMHSQTTLSFAYKECPIRNGYANFPQK